jgi:hypothetical protein
MLVSDQQMPVTEPNTQGEIATRPAAFASLYA